MMQFRPGRFEVLPVVIKNLLIINGLVFLAQLAFDHLNGSGNMAVNMGIVSNNFALHHILSPLFKPWQIVTHLFLHGSIDHLIGNMFALWMFGSTLENLWGPRRFITFYIICGLGAAVLHLASLYYESYPLLKAFADFKATPNYNTFMYLYNNYIVQTGIIVSPQEALQQWQMHPDNIEFGRMALPIAKEGMNAYLMGATVGASGAVMGCSVAFGYMFPDNEIIAPPIFFPIKAKYYVTFYVLLELYLGARNSAGDNVAHFAHLGGALVGFLLVYFWNKTNKRRYNKW